MRWLNHQLGRPLQPLAEFVATRRLFLFLLAVVQLCAILSFWSQLDGLQGAHGITPSAQYLHDLRENLGGGLWHIAPGILLLDASDSALHVTCALATLAAICLALGRAPRLALLLFWLCYLSLCSASDEFLNFQWDSLLLETTLLATLLAPRGIFRPQWQTPPVSIAVWSLRWLLFRLYFLSGVVKLASGDPSWRDGTAMSFHYWTQPLPGPLSWLASALPLRFHQLETFLTLALELLIPLGLFLPRKLRVPCAVVMLVLQLSIGLTGNYGYFNLLSALLCVSALDDRALSRLLPQRLRARLPVPDPAPVQVNRRALVGVLCASLLALSTLAAFARVAPQQLPEPLRELHAYFQPFRSANSYGLFANMTKERPEIEIEGSLDGQTWTPYVLPWKPGPLERMPAWCQPHMPRLDWQLWFAGLAHHCRNAQWTLGLFKRLLEKEPAVLGLFAQTPPFAPRYVRSTVWQYRFADPQEHARGLWWKRTRQVPFCPTLKLDENGDLARAEILD